MLDPRFTLLVPSLPPSEGRKQGPEHVPDHGGRILETQGECWSVLGQTGRRSGEVRRGQARSGGSPHHRGWSMVRPLAPVLVFAVCPLCSSFKMATSARLPGQDTNCLQSSGGWRLLAVEESLAWSEAGLRMVGVSAACSCRRQLPTLPTQIY